MTETLERTDVLETAFVVIDVDDYLDVRQPGWTVLEKPGAVEARDGKVHVNPDLLRGAVRHVSRIPGQVPAARPADLKGGLDVSDPTVSHVQGRASGWPPGLLQR